jgi:hypothetical protein
MPPGQTPVPPDDACATPRPDASAVAGTPPALQVAQPVAVRIAANPHPLDGGATQLSGIARNGAGKDFNFPNQYRGLCCEPQNAVLI